MSILYNEICIIEEILPKYTYLKKMNMNVQWKQFSNLSAWNNPRWVELPLKSIKQTPHQKKFQWSVKQ